MMPLAILDDFSNNGIVPFVMNARNSYLELIAETHPIHVENNASFLVDLDHLQQPEDLLSDDLGSWDQSKRATKKYLLAWNDGLVTKIAKVPEHREDGHCVCRRTFINKSDNCLGKTIVNVVLPDSQHHNLVFVRYYFEGAPEHQIKLKAHGNAKTGSIPYIRTDRSTVTKMKAAVSRSKAGLKNVVYQVEEDVGGLTKWQKSLGDSLKKALSDIPDEYSTDTVVN